MSEQKKMYTLSDIAKELGVNKATVSKAISGKGNLSAQTRARILAFTQECGYRPNAVAQSLARNRSYNIGLMMPDYVGVLDESFFRECLRGVCRIASNNGYDVLMVMDSEKPVERIARLIDNRKIDGVIAMRSLVRSPVVDFLKEKQVPFVIIGPSSDQEVLSVDNDNRGACRDMTAHLIAGGARRMALIGGDDNNCVTHSRLEGFWDACDWAGVRRDEQMVYLNVLRDNRLPEVLDEVLLRKTDCIVCMDDYLCNLVLIHLRTSGVRIPQDVKVVSFYDNPLLENNIPAITSLRFDAGELGKIACQKLINTLGNKPDENFVLPGYQMLLRDSTE
ncbi:MAG: LacI family DNA-binding transcriptional regulator [Faecousia sp.]